MDAVKTRRAIVIVISCLFILMLLFSHLFILAEADHDCSGENCPICEVILIAEKTLRGISLLICAAAIAALAVVAAIRLRGEAAFGAFRFTPVLLKVKLTN